MGGLGSQNRRKGEQRAVDLSETPELLYVHDECDDCYVPVDHDVDLGEGIVLHDHQRHCQGRLVHFSLSLKVIGDPNDHELSRIDTSHGTVHQHFYNRDGQMSKEHIADIPPDDPHPLLDGAQLDAYDTLTLNVDIHRERW